MDTDFPKKRALILSDDEGLAKAVALNLNGYLEVVRHPSLSAGKCESQIEAGVFDLIILAMSSPTSEPVVALARASLAERIGRVPLLIISDRPFRSEPDDKITHLDFPFKIDELHRTVKNLVFGRQATSTGQVTPEPAEPADKNAPAV